MEESGGDIIINYDCHNIKMKRRNHDVCFVKDTWDC